MIITPQATDFVNGIYTIAVTDSYSILLNSISERVGDGEDDLFECLHIEAQLVEAEGTYALPCPSIIGMRNALIALNTNDPSLVGEAISMSNIGKWSLEVYES